MRRLLLILLTCCAVGVLPAASLTERQAAYVKAGRAVVDMVNSKAVDNDKVAALILAMEKEAVPLAQAYAAKFPPGKDLINTVIAKVAVVDNHWATVGSSNIDPFSLWLSREASR